MWTQFMDMHSGGGTKTDHSHIYIEADEEAATAEFKRRYGRDPHNVTCDCCGEDYSISTSATLEQETGYNRGCTYDVETNKYVERHNEEGWLKYQPLEEFLKQDGLCFIYAKDIGKED